MKTEKNDENRKQVTSLGDKGDQGAWEVNKRVLWGGRKMVIYEDAIMKVVTVYTQHVLTKEQQRIGLEIQTYNLGPECTNLCSPFRVTTMRGAEHRSVSEVVSFTTPGCEPDPPLAPTLISRTKNSLSLQWKVRI